MFKPLIANLLRYGAALAFASSAALADHVTLQTGETLEGAIVRETAEEVVIEVEVSNGIIDQRTLPKAEVKAVFKTPRDEKDYAEVKNLKVGPNSLSVAGYDAAIASLEGFLRVHPTSEYGAEIRTELAAFKAEKARIKKGDLKWNHRWYTPKDAAKEIYQISGFRLYQQMRELASRGDFVGALNAFDRLERNFPGSRSFPDAVELALALAPRLSAEIDRALPIAKLQDQRFEEGIVLVSEPEKSRTIAARKAQLAAAEAALSQAEKAQIKWKPFFPRIPKSGDTLKTTCASEIERLQKLPLSSMRASLAEADAAAQAVEAKDLASAEARLAKAKALWANNEIVQKLDPSVVALKAELAATPTPSPSPAASPAAQAGKSGGASAQQGAKPAAKPAASPAPSAAG